jgi:hypothetical protein
MSLKIHFLHLHLDFFPRELWRSECWTRKTFPSSLFFNWEEISREMEVCYARWLLLDFGKGCPYHGIQATGKTKQKSHELVCIKYWTYVKRTVQMFILCCKYYP